MCIGAVAAGTDSGLYFLLTRKFGIWYLAANFMSVNIGITISFMLNSFVNFKKSDRLFRRAVFFYGICYVGMLISMSVLFTGTKILGFSDVPVKIAAVLMAGTVQFLFNKFVTYERI